jgi:hypothetical protein
VKARPTPSAAAVPPASAARESILLNCQWHDPAWTLKPTNALEQGQPERVRWDFQLPSGRRFTDPAYAPLLESARTLIALIRARSLGTGLASRASTAAGYGIYLRILIRWMEEHHFTRFADLDELASSDFSSTSPSVATPTAATSRPRRSRSTCTCCCTCTATGPRSAMA